MTVIKLSIFFFGLQLIKVFGSKVRVDSTAKVAELELAEKVSSDFTILN